MNADAAFTIGRTHRICQDYARAAKEGQYVLLADGCSSSPDSDFGARLLIKSYENSFSPIAAINNAAAGARVLQLAEESLDATLLVASYDKTTSDEPIIRTQAFGDGVIVAQHKNGWIEAYQLEYHSGYPEYLSYSLDPERQARLKEVTKGNDLTITRWLIQKDGKFEKDEPETRVAGVVVTDFRISEYDTVAVFSDGVGTFTDSHLNVLPWQSVVREMMDFGPARKGEFVQRQMNWMVKEIGKRKWSHADDFSMAAINLQ